MSIRGILEEIGVSGLIDVTFVGLLIYGLLVWIRRTRRAALALGGILIVTVVYLLAQQFELLLTVAVLQGFFAVILIALVVIFQEELRYLFERIAAWGLGRKLPSERRPPEAQGTVEILVRTLTDLSRERIGALIVLRGNDPLSRHLDGGEALGGRVSEALLKSLFDPHSMGHDGAVVLEGDRVSTFGALLPLSRSRPPGARFGSRHVAALGLSERSDALCLVVSEERGAISVAHHGRLNETQPAELPAQLEEFLRETTPERAAGGLLRLLTSNVREKLVAIAIAFALWFVLVHGSSTVYRTFRVPVRLAHVPAQMTLSGIEPAEIEITLSGARKSFYFVRLADLRVELRTWELEAGRSSVPVASSDLSFPENLILENIKPRAVDVEIASVP